MSAGRLRGGERLAAIGAVALLIALFALDWFPRRAGLAGWWSYPPLSQRLYLADHRSPLLTGWQAMPTLRWFALVAAALALAAVLAQAASRGPALPVTLDLLATIVAAVTSILLVIRLATAGDLRFGAVLGLAGAVGATAGAYRALRAEQGWTPGPERAIEVVVMEVPGGPGG